MPRTQPRARWSDWCQSSRFGAARRYTDRVRWLLPVCVLLFGVACATPPTGLTARVATPKSVSRHEPGGDALNAHEAALTRLVEQPIGNKTDKFGTLRARFPDARHWTRVRFFGYPTRAGFRYGEDHHAVALLSYEDAPEGEDSPDACIARFLGAARRTARKFSVDIDPIQRETRQHVQGVEALDPELQVRRKQAIERTKLRREKLLEQRKHTAPPRRDSKPKVNGRRPPAVRRSSGARPRAMTRARRRDPRRWARVGAIKGDKHWNDMRRRMWRNDRRKKVEASKRRADMPVVVTGGEMMTVFNNDRYLAAIAAYRSWPGTCLIQGFAVRVEQDEALAQLVLDRWLDEAAPGLSWRTSLYEAPPREDR